MLILASGGLSLLHRHIALLPQTNIGDIAQMAFVLAGMMLASLGMLLLIFGALLFADERHSARFDGKPVYRGVRVTPHRRGLSKQTEKAMMATFLAHRAEAVAAERRQRG